MMSRKCSRIPACCHFQLLARDAENSCLTGDGREAGPLDFIAWLAALVPKPRGSRHAGQGSTPCR
jgi:hypothetical protein